MRSTIRKVCLANAVMLATAHSSPLSAQNLALDEILVTAQKRAESLQDVPISVSALNANDIESLRLRAATEIAAQVPNMQISTPYGDGFPLVSMRGVSMSDFSLNQSSPVASYVDEVYKGNPAIQGVQLYDLERIEVLRGPQGTLYGKNTTGGAVNFITKKPTHETEGYLTVGAGNYSRKEVQGAFQASLTDTLAARVAGTWADADGWNENQLAGFDDFNAVDEWGARLSLVYTPTERLEMILRAASSESDPVNYGIIADEGPAGVGAGFYELFDIAGMIAGGANGGQSTSYFRDHLDDFELESDNDGKRNIETDSVALTINYDLTDKLSLTSITSWDDGEFFVPEDADGAPTQTLGTENFADVDQVTQDLRITSGFDGTFNFIAGLYYGKEEVEANTRIDIFNDLDTNQDGALDTFDCLDPLFYAFGLGGIATTPAADAVNAVISDPDFQAAAGLPPGTSLATVASFGCQLQNSYEQTRTSYAGYFDGTQELNDKFTLRLGLRYTEDESELDDFESRLKDNGGNDLTDVVGFLIPSTDDDFTDKEWSGKFGIDYMMDSGALLYASYSRGYRSGAFNGQAFLDPAEVNSVDPEKVDAFEIGFKSDFFDNRLQLNGAAFYYDYSDQQFLNVDTATLAQTLVNLDESEIAGFELELNSRPIEALTVRAGLGWLDTEVEKGELSGVDLSGNELLQAPEWNFNLAADYDVSMGDLGMLTLHMDTAYVDEQYFDVFNTPGIKVDDYWVTNARASWEAEDSRFTVALWVKNIADKVYQTQAIDLQASFGYNLTQTGAPRTYGAELTYRF